MKIIQDYHYIKNHCRFIVVDLSRQNEVDADPKAIQQIEFIEESKYIDGQNAYGKQFMFVLTIWEKSKKRN